MKTKIAIFASGGGSNAEVIIQHFEKVVNAEITLIVTNKASSFVLERAQNHKIPAYVHTSEGLTNGQLETALKSHGIDFIILAGYLKKIQPSLIKMYPNKIVNIHPALLPKFGGKGMYGMHVHRAVVEAKEKESGITIHYVNENYDEGSIIAQHRCKINEKMSPEEVQKAVLKLEHEFFAPSIESLL